MSKLCEICQIRNALAKINWQNTCWQCGAIISKNLGLIFTADGSIQYNLESEIYKEKLKLYKQRLYWHKKKKKKKGFNAYQKYRKKE